MFNIDDRIKGKPTEPKWSLVRARVVETFSLSPWQPLDERIILIFIDYDSNVDSWVGQTITIYEYLFELDVP